MIVQAIVKKVVGQAGGPVDVYLICPGAAEGITVVSMVASPEEELPGEGDSVTLELLRAKSVAVRK